MLEEYLAEQFGDDIKRIRSFFPDVRLLRVNGQYYLSGVSDTAASLSLKYSIDWRNPL